MNDQTDSELLLAYAERQVEPAFAELVRRHIDFVFSAAKRMTGDAHLAEDVTQGVFVALAQNAVLLAQRATLLGWLHRTAQNLAGQAMRTDMRRRKREQEAVIMNELLAAKTEVSWEDLAPQLDAAMGELEEPDREALFLRFFMNQNLRAVGTRLGISDDAAQKRVGRAVERLREFLEKRGVAVGAGGLAALVAANAVQAAPVGLVTAIASAAVVSGAVAGSAVVVAAKAIVMTALQKTLVAAAIAGLAGAGIYEERQAVHLRQQVQQLQAQQGEQGRQWQSEWSGATNELAALRAENLRLNSNSNALELLRLRGEVTRLEGSANDPTRGAAEAIAAKVRFLKQCLERMPEKKIPELQFAAEKDWTDAVWDADLDTDDGIREALSKVRDRGESIFIGQYLHEALTKYLAANNGILPAEKGQLKPYFEIPVTDELLGRYQLLKSGKADDTAKLVKSAAPYADPDYDSDHYLTLDGSGGERFNKVQQAVDEAARYFAADNNGQMAATPSQIMPYLKKDIDTIAIQKYLDIHAAQQEQTRREVVSPEMDTLAPALRKYRAEHDGSDPKRGADLLPYLSTAAEWSALEKVEEGHPGWK